MNVRPTTDIRKVHLPDISLLRKYAAEAAKFEPLSFFSNIPIDDEQRRKIKEHRSLLEEATLAAKGPTYATIVELADFFDLDGTFWKDMPSIFVADERRASNFFDRIRLDNICAPHTYYPCTCYFTSKGQGYFDHPDGPVISLYLPSVSIDSLVEEGVHFLDWFNRTGEVERNFLHPRLSYGDYDVRDDIGQIITSSNESGVLTAKFSGSNLQNQISCKIVAEALAYFTREVCGVNKSESKYEHQERINDEDIVGIPEDTPNTKLIEIMLEGGREDCYGALLEWNKVNSFRELMESHHFTRMVGSFPGGIIHLLGYGLGKALSEDIKTQEQVRDFSDRVFKTNRGLNDTLDELIDLHQLIYS
jgi:hypothetical protein